MFFSSTHFVQVLFCSLTPVHSLHPAKAHLKHLLDSSEGIGVKYPSLHLTHFGGLTESFISLEHTSQPSDYNVSQFL